MPTSESNTQYASPRRRGGAVDSGATVGVTGAAADVLARLEAAHGPLALFLWGSRPDRTTVVCLKQGELPVRPTDIWLGDIGGAPCYIDADQHDRWNRPRFVIDVSPGAAASFSLEGLEGVHFVTRKP